jgi:YD repeat-containing protein
MSGREAVRSAAFVFALVLLCAVCAAAPGFAEEAPPLPPDEALESPQAEAEREASELAYANLSTGEEEQLLREQFEAQLEAIDSDPARVLDELTLERIDSPTEALVNLGGETLLLEAEVPLRAREEDGDLRKVELGLEESAEGYEPANPLVDLTLPASSDEPIEIGDRGLSVSAVGADDTSASPIGDEDLFLPAVHEDTSLLLSPIARGVEVSALLASRNSPEQLAFELTPPQGATLRSSDEGGAEVVDGEGGVLAMVSAPHAVDAQGTEVPVTLRAEGDRFYLEIAHRQMDVAYPLFVDPEITEDWSGFTDTSKLNYWKWSWSGVGSEDYIGKTSCIVTCWGNGLYVRSRSSFSYPKGSWGRWWFVPQGSTTYMYRVIVGPMNYDAHGCTANEPHPYVGVWNDSGVWKVLSNAYPSGWANYIDTGGQNLGPGTRTAFVGIEAASGASISCGHDYRLGGAMLFLEDQEKPTVGTISGYPTGWIKSGASFTISAPVSDPGLGVYSGTLSPKGSPPVEKKHGCDGHYANPCPSSYTFQFPIGAASFDEGEKAVEFTAMDARSKPSNTSSWMLKVDRTPPEIGVSGQFAEATDETEGDAKDDRDKALIFPTYSLTVNATDGRVGTVANPVQPAEKRSGVKKIEVFVDQSSTPLQSWEASSCAAGNCPLSKTFTLKLNELSADTDHYLRILVRDFAGNAAAERKLEFEYIPATGMKDEYVMQYFPLPDGSGNEAEEEHPQRPELAVNLLSGNLVYRQQDAEVEGPGADLGVELFYNSLLPESQNTEWGDGWTMAQAPELEIEEPAAPGPPSEATVVEESGGVESSIDLPASTGEESFDKTLQATVTKEAGGGYEVADESGETDGAYVFDASGQVEEARTGTAATVEYDSEGGDLSQISVEDPATANVDPETIDEGEVFPDPEILHSANFGSNGTADGQFKIPADVATDSQGNVWVLDRGNGRVQKLGPDGQFISKFGEGKLETPSAIALDAAGNIVISEYGRVQKFSPQGQLLTKFGSWGSAEGLINLTTGIAVGIDGSIWVSDYTSVQRFTASGQFIERVGASGTGKVLFAQSLDTAPNGDVVIGDGEADAVKIFNKDGDFVRQFGSAGSGPGQFMTITEVDVDPEGNIWVADSQADRIQLFSADGDFVAQFGSPGTGAQQFQLNNNSGIAADGHGRVWVADPENSRLERWFASNFPNFLHSANFGSNGTADGQFKIPADVATDSQGNVWVLDRGNGRVQKLGPDGQFISKFGEGKLETPSAIALDAAGNIVISEYGRVQKFSPQGQLLTKFGSWGSAEGLINLTTGIAVGIDGSIWVSDYTSVQRFTASGQFIERVGASGTGKVLFAQSLDTAPNGDVVIGDGEADAVKIFNKDGDFVRQFGSAGSGPGQFMTITEVDVDPEGNIWVADSQADRIQLFSADGDFVAQFGSPGTGAQQFQLNNNSGIAADGHGRVWVADPENSRLDEWIGGSFEPSTEPSLTEDDPQLDVEVSEGLVDSVEGEEVGTIDYVHSGDLLTSVTAPDGKASFTYDGAGRMTKVTLPNGTYGEIAYEATYGRVKSVTVAVEGKNPKTTYFAYSDEPRRTTVTPPNAPATTYDIAADGSIFKWWNSKSPPVFTDIGGTLYDPNNRETNAPIATGAHTLLVQAHDDEGLASIQIVANNDQLVDEKTCEYPSEPSKCVAMANEWVTETGNWPPGILYLEVIATDRLGEAASQRFWVNIPYTPPPDPEAEEPPRYNDILKFREEFGLDLDLKGDEMAINDRIFDLMGAWHNPSTPDGEVARATAAKWGVPLRPVDIAELEYRQAYIAQAASAIPQWAQAHASGSYAGYYVDHRAGGIIHVGFTSNQAATVTGLAQSGVFMAPTRLSPFPSTPKYTYAELVGAQGAIGTQSSSLPPITQAGIDLEQNTVDVGTTESVVALEGALSQLLGPGNPTHAFFDQSPPVPNDRKNRDRLFGRVRAGDRIRSEKVEWCTAGFGAWLEGGMHHGQTLFKHFLLTAAHCGAPDDLFYREAKNPNTGVYEYENLGHVRRNGIQTSPQVDGAAILLQGEADGWAPRQIYLGPNASQPVVGAVEPVPGMIVCTSGVTTDRVTCGEVQGPPVSIYYTSPPIEGNPGVDSSYMVPVGILERHGDSGAPVWQFETGNAIGLWNAGNNPSFVTPLLPMTVDSDWQENIGPHAPGILAKLGFSPGNLSVAK